MVKKIINIDIVNILLMILSLITAFYFPFELFLFSYIILGPLHYMTELTWLKGRNFFLPDLKSWKLIFLLSIIGVLFILYADISSEINFLTATSENIARQLFVAVLFAVLVLSFLFQFFGDSLTRIFLFTSLIGIALIASQNLWFIIVIAILLPTIIHTTIFTGSFMLEGALKNRNLWGYLAFIVFIMCNVFFFIVSIDPSQSARSSYSIGLYNEGEFYHLNDALTKIFYGSVKGEVALTSSIGLKIQSFIAFGYTYHYLNWFSKTEVIKWHKIPKKWLRFSILIWIFSIAIHLVNIKIGIIFISLLSLLHVCMEFPLNFKSASNISKIFRQFEF